jgi:hypothetical protein
MNKSIFRGFFHALEKNGHKNAHYLTSIDFKNLIYLNSVDSFERSIKTICDSEYGVFFYTENQKFSTEFIGHIRNSIIREENIHSDLLGGKVKILVYQQENQHLKLIFVYSSILNLKLL